ncbi:MAG TPA: MBL fold metallo-hydrolase [Polyangia bacterium]|nr:MBL fold metallo-hydrolase [Polyangia bacterium]
MQVRFWGVRGSIASSGSRLAQVGGNTSCVEVRCGEPGAEQTIILDAGTGLRDLGAELMRRGPVDAALLVSHFHWDHIQGFPFFVPAYVPGNRVAIYGGGGGARPGGGCASLRAAFEAQMRAPHFPVDLGAMRATLEFREVSPGARFNLGAVEVRTAAARHPNGCLAWRLDFDGRSVVYATDHEHDDSGRPDAGLLELARGADVLIYDAQYTPEEYAAGKRGWGHSTAEEGARLAAAAGASQLVLFHHDPGRDDWQVACIEAETRGRFPLTVAAREGLVLTLDGAARKKAA